MLLPFGGKVPRDEGAVFVAPNATVLWTLDADGFFALLNERLAR